MEDVCAALYKVLIDKNIGETFHISTKKFINILELVKIIKKILKYKKKFTIM